MEIAPPIDDADRGGKAGMIHLSLAAIIAHCPDEIFEGGRPMVDDSVRLAFPFEPIEQQLIDGKVEITLQSFLAALPPKFAGSFRNREGGAISLPLEEIFLNLPGKAGPQPTAPKPTAVTFPELAEKQLPQSIVAEIVPAPEPPVQSIAESPASDLIEAPAPYRFFTPAPPPLQRVEPPPSLEKMEDLGEPQKAEGVGGEAAPQAAVEALPPVVLPVVKVVDEVSAAAIPMAAPAEAAPPAARMRPTGFPPLRALVLCASSDAPPTDRPTLTVLQSSHAEHSPTPPHSAAPVFGVQRPPLLRPLVVLPPPILGTAAPAAQVADELSATEPRLETTADQAAVLDFLSGSDGAQA